MGIELVTVGGPIWHPARHHARADVLVVELVPLDADLAAVWTIDDAGDLWPWLARTGPDRGHVLDGCACTSCAEHEHPGRPLPDRIRRRLDARP
jgi:hypothetical protein